MTALFRGPSCLTPVFLAHKIIQKIFLRDLILLADKERLQVSLFAPVDDSRISISCKLGNHPRCHDIRLLFQTVLVVLPDDRVFFFRKASGPYSQKWFHCVPFPGIALIIACRRKIPIRMRFSALNILYDIVKQDYKAPCFLMAVVTWNKPALQKKEAGPFADMADTVHLLFCDICGILPPQFSDFFVCHVHTSPVLNSVSTAEMCAHLHAGIVSSWKQARIRDGFSLLFLSCFLCFSPISLLFPVFHQNSRGFESNFVLPETTHPEQDFYSKFNYFRGLLYFLNKAL